MSESTVWHQEEKTNEWTEYYVAIVDGDKKISFVLKYNSATTAVVAEPYSLPDINYTIHDACNHEDDECVLDDPDSFESQDVFMAEKYGRSINKLEAQVKQQCVAEQLVKAKSAQ